MHVHNTSSTLRKELLRYNYWYDFVINVSITMSCTYYNDHLQIFHVSVYNNIIIMMVALNNEFPCYDRCSN